MKYSSVKGLYEVFGLENMDFEDFCWHLYKNGIITAKECIKYKRMERNKMSKVVKRLETEIKTLEKELNQRSIQDINGDLTNVKVHEKIKLNPDQQTVLNWLKTNVEEYDMYPMFNIYLLEEWKPKIGSEELKGIDIAYWSLNPKQQAQVLQVFGEWCNEREEANESNS